jgi:hypothetical protein
MWKLICTSIRKRQVERRSFVACFIVPDNIYPAMSNTTKQLLNFTEKSRVVIIVYHISTSTVVVYSTNQTIFAIIHEQEMCYPFSKLPCSTASTPSWFPEHYFSQITDVQVCWNVGNENYS